MALGPPHAEKSTMTSEFSMGALLASRTLTRKAPLGLGVVPANPTMYNGTKPATYLTGGPFPATGVHVHLVGSGTCAIATLAASRPQAQKKVALRTKPVIVAPP